MFVFGQGCYQCKRSSSDPAYRKDPRTGERLYWMDPKNHPELKEFRHFCSPECVLVYVKEQAARSGEENRQSDSP